MCLFDYFHLDEEFHVLLHISCLAVVDGHIKRPQDEDIQSNVLEIIGANV
jgi:hypothetical protein